MTEDQIRELFREMRDEPVPADSQVRVRMSVEERTQGWRERLRGYWKTAAMILVPVCAVLIALIAREPARTSSPPAPVMAQTAEPAVQVQTADSTPAVVRVRHRALHPVADPVVKRDRPPEAATLIRIETPDPEVVILLIGG